MDRRLLESLLNQEESETLDFKREQYRFYDASDNEKSEVLKDVLAFANAWRQSDAYILIGVEEVKGGRSIVRGVRQHLLNEHLQQFVIAKTNRPVLFNYAPVAFDGLEIGVLTIQCQDRPLFLKHQYGKLKPDVVYIRRGATTASANPDEICRMGQALISQLSEPTLVFEFADLDHRRELGTCIVLRSTVVLTPEPSDIPSYGEDPWFDASFLNRDYYRDVAAYICEKQILTPIGFRVKNVSPSPAEQVRVVLTISAEERLIVRDAQDLRPTPSATFVPTIRGTFIQREPTVTVQRFGNIYEIKGELGTIHPRTVRWSPEKFYMGATHSLTTFVQVTVSANNLPTPIGVDAEIDIEVATRDLPKNEIVRRAREIIADTEYSKPAQRSS